MAASARVDGVLVQRMVPRGVEIIVGGRVDPQFGPLVLVGIGGTLVELMKDTAVGLAPVTPAQARGMIDALKGAAMLDGFRGQPAVDRAALADIVCRASEFLADNAALIAELDVNPLICAGGEIVAVDALIGLRRA
jgi:acetyl-CoA synthetase